MRLGRWLGVLGLAVVLPGVAWHFGDAPLSPAAARLIAAPEIHADARTNGMTALERLLRHALPEGDRADNTDEAIDRPGQLFSRSEFKQAVCPRLAADRLDRWRGEYAALLADYRAAQTYQHFLGAPFSLSTPADFRWMSRALFASRMNLLGVCEDVARQRPESAAGTLAQEIEFWRVFLREPVGMTLRILAAKRLQEIVAYAQALSPAGASGDLSVRGQRALRRALRPLDPGERDNDAIFHDYLRASAIEVTRITESGQWVEYPAYLLPTDQMMARMNTPRDAANGGSPLPRALLRPGRTLNVLADLEDEIRAALGRENRRERDGLMADIASRGQRGLVEAQEVFFWLQPNPSGRLLVAVVESGAGSLLKVQVEVEKIASLLNAPSAAGN